MWAGRVARAAEQAQVWWAEGTERVAARARERWNEQVSTQRTTARQPAAVTTATAHRFGTYDPFADPALATLTPGCSRGGTPGVRHPAR